MSVIINTPNNQGLFTHLSFNEESGDIVRDYSGNNNHGMLINSPTRVDGQFGKVINFNGLNNYIKINKPIYALSSVYSLSFWLKINDLTATNQTIYLEGSSILGNPIFSLTFNRASEDYKIGVFIKNDAGAILKIIKTNQTINDNNWHHINWMDNNGTVQFYIDKILDSTSFSYVRSGVFSLDTSSIASRVSFDYPNGSFYLNGQIDEFRIYNRIISQDEVNILYDSGLTILNSLNSTVLT